MHDATLKNNTVHFASTKCEEFVYDIEDLLAVRGRLFRGVIYRLKVVSCSLMEEGGAVKGLFLIL
jgi:hypothetical protein